MPNYPTIYQSTDTDAPVLSGTLGSLIGVLDACLVNGYGSKVAAGWTKAFSGTNQAAYRQGTGNIQYYLRVNDNGPVSSDPRGGTWHAFETMSSVTTGTNMFPTGNYYIQKTATFGDTTARPWIVIADDRTLYIGIIEDTTTLFKMYAFGEFYTFSRTDKTYNVFISASPTYGGTPEFHNVGYSSANIASGAYVARLANGTGISNGLSWTVADIGVGSTGQSANFPNGFGGGAFVTRRLVYDGSKARGLRGHFRGFWELANGADGISHGDTFSGLDDLSGREFFVVKPFRNVNHALAIEISLWE